MGNVTYHVGDLIDGLHDKLTHADRPGPAARRRRQRRRLRRRRRLRSPGPGQGDRVPGTASRAAADVWRLDVQAAYDGDPAVQELDEIIFCYPGLEAITVYRLAHVLHQLEVPFIPRMMTEWAHSKTGIDIHPGATIGHHFFIDHGTGVVIGETCEIGNHVKLYQGVTLGALSFATDGDGNLVRGTQAASDDRRPRGDLRQRHGPRRQDGRRPRLGDRFSVWLTKASSRTRPWCWKSRSSASAPTHAAETFDGVSIIRSRRHGPENKSRIFTDFADEERQVACVLICVIWFLGVKFILPTSAFVYCFSS